MKSLGYFYTSDSWQNYAKLEQIYNLNIVNVCVCVCGAICHISNEALCAAINQQMP